jgi:hypothetical protein
MNPKQWQKAPADIFWGEIAPSDHVVQIYKNDAVFINSLVGFVGAGIKAGECVILIATAAHLKAVEEKLNGYGVFVRSLIEEERYIALDAHETLSKFMINDWPDEELFIKTISSVIEKGTCRQRKVRAFGEMVAILWAQGLNGATVRLEHFWNKFCDEHKFSLFCAYPKAGFTQDINDSISKICNCHAKMINGEEVQLYEVIYKNICEKEAV